ncbi:MAG TPA: GrpB family protein [Candidatus Limnocylindrales bacterium]|nr:GrpB family protein [Candidatus Limnocylindrales bacterium]
MTSISGGVPAIEVVDYDPAWPARFEAIRARIAPALGTLAIAIEHVGSTSVPGLAAKPVIDIDVVVADEASVSAAIDGLARLGYEHLGDLGVRDREAFRRPPGTERHNLYVCRAGGEGLRNHLALRDHLRSHPEAVQAYGALKRRLATEVADIDEYVIAKTDLIVSFLRAEGIDEKTLDAIEAANKAPPA